MAETITTALTVYFALYLLKEATVWDHLKDLTTRRSTPRDFLTALWSCPVCLGVWVSLPAAVIYGPLVWAAANGALVLAAAVAPIQPRAE